jgi:thioredoxin reductase (NADPH)
MSEEGVHYVNAWASFTDSNTIMFRYKGLFEDTNVEYSLKAKNFVISTGGRPRFYPGIHTDLIHTSDEIFSLKTDPGVTLVLGVGYIAIECAGFLSGLGKKVYLANRSTFLRSMD